MGETNFVARGPELRTLQSYLNRAREGQGRLCFVVGDAGSGKTSLVQEFTRREFTRDSELLVATGACNAQGGIGDPFLPFR